MSALWSIMVGWLPAWVQMVILVIVALALVILLIRIIGAILDAIPFI